MRKAQLALAVLVGVFALMLGVTASGQMPQRPSSVVPSLKTAVAKASKQKEADVEAVFKALGPAIAEQIRAGREVNLPGVGVIRIVRVLGHKDLVGGRPAFIPSKNYIEFVPTSDVTTAASSPGAKPSRDAAAWEFTVDPNTGPGQRAAMIRAPNDPFATSSATGVSPGLRTPGTRTPSSRIP